jgi:S-adenosylmethionine-diacylgycerolhomoserine-N-methlytransferase
VDTRVQRFYRLHSRVYDYTRWLFLFGRKQAVSALGLRPDSRVLEVGCGTGLNFRYILELLDLQRGRLLGVDFSEHMLVRARRRASRCGWSNVQLMQADAAVLQLSQQFDAILFAYSLAMIPDWQGALERAHDHLRPGGRIVVHDFGNFAGWGPLGAVIRGWLRLNHAETTRPSAAGMLRLFDDVIVQHRLGGWYFTAAAQKNR